MNQCWKITNTDIKAFPLLPDEMAHNLLYLLLSFGYCANIVTSCMDYRRTVHRKGIFNSTTTGGSKLPVAKNTT